MVHACMLGVNECATLSWSYSHDGWSRDAAGVSQRTAVPCVILLLPPSPGTWSGTLTSCSFFCIFGPLDSKDGDHYYVSQKASVRTSRMYVDM
jgi:hypothetical protein